MSASLGVSFFTRAGSQQAVKSVHDEIIADEKARRKELSRGVRDQLAILQQVHKTQVIRRGGGAPVAGVWTRRSGELSRSFTIDWRPGDLQGSYGSTLKRSRIMEEGGTIRPRKAKFLAIPTKNAPKGIPSPRFMPGLVYIQSLRGQPLLVRPTATGFVTMFILRRKVVLPPRPTLDKAIAKSEAARTAIMESAVERIIRGGE